MPEPSETRQPQNRRKAALIIIVAVVISLLIYGSGVIALPLSILSSYQSKNCESMLSLHSLYTALYPAFMEDQTLSDPVMECAVYTLANIEEGKEDWAGSYNAYKVYASTYPNGLLMEDVRQHAASVLTNLTKEQISEKKFTDALANLNLILVNYGDTDSSQVVLDLFPQLYETWGDDLRNVGKFEEAFGVYSNYHIWAENHQKTEHSKLAQKEIAQTYLDWGLQLQSQKNFQEAEAKFESAKSADSTLAVQIKANEEKLHSTWGDFLIEQKDFAGAMEHYSLAAKLVEESDPIAAKDVIANGYIQWAGGLSAEEDFIGALVLLDFAQENAASDSVKKSVDEARTGIYLAFSKSDGEQAKKAMRDAAAIVCKYHSVPIFPIFGVDNNAVLAGMYGVEGTLPSQLAATTPGSLHFVACVEEEAKVIESAINSIGSFLFDPNPPYYTVKVQFNRLQYIWSVTLFEVSTGDEIGKTIIEGGDPPPLPTTPYGIYNGAKSPKYFGIKPDLAELADWLAESLK